MSHYPLVRVKLRSRVYVFAIQSFLGSAEACHLPLAQAPTLVLSRMVRRRLPAAAAEKASAEVQEEKDATGELVTEGAEVQLGRLPRQATAGRLWTRKTRTRATVTRRCATGPAKCSW